MEPQQKGSRRWAHLRVRLTLSYVLFITVILLGVGFLFHQTLDYTLHASTMQVLNDEVAAIKGYMKIEDPANPRVSWFFDPQDSEEAFYVRRLRRIFLLTDDQGRVLEASDAYGKLGVESPQEIRSYMASQLPIWRVRPGPDGKQYLIRLGRYVDEGHRVYLLANGRTLDTNQIILSQFTVRYFTAVPLLILLVCLAGWFASGRALRPLHRVTHVAQTITGDHLDVRIPRRGANDELDHLIDTFNSMVDRLQGSFNQIRQFSTDVSHELRTPLTAVRGQLEVALFTAQTSEQYRDAIVAAIEDVDQLSRVIRALLQLSQAESGQLALAHHRVPLAAITRNVVDQFQIGADSAAIDLTCGLDDRVVVQGDQVQLERLVSNLLSNAIKYTSPGGRIRVEVSSRSRLASLVIEDTGRGIAAAHLPHIFDRLYRVPDGRADPDRGLGLGLSFVAWIVKAHNGKVEVHSEPGQGSRFEVTLPLASLRRDADEPGPMTEHRAPAGGARIVK